MHVVLIQRNNIIADDNIRDVTLCRLSCLITVQSRITIVISSCHAFERYRIQKFYGHIFHFKRSLKRIEQRAVTVQAILCRRAFTLSSGFFIYHVHLTLIPKLMCIVLNVDCMSFERQDTRIKNIYCSIFAKLYSCKSILVLIKIVYYNRSHFILNIRKKYGGGLQRYFD